MALIEGKWIEDGAVTADKVKLENDSFLKGRNAGDSADVNIIKVNGSDALELGLKLNDPSSAAPTSDTELANKKYVDDQVAGVVVPNAFDKQGNWNASTNTPALANTDTGVDDHLYFCNVAGSVDFGAGSISFDAGDWVYYANSIWNKADNVDPADTDALAEGSTNFYYTEGRFDTSLATKDTADLTEGTNLYFTDTRVEDATLANFSVGADSAITSSDDVKTAFGKAQGQINALSSASTLAKNVVLSLDATDISNGYKDLVDEATTVLGVSPLGGTKQEVGVDYTLSVVSTVTRITFAGDLASLLANGDKLLVDYLY